MCKARDMTYQDHFHHSCGDFCLFVASESSKIWLRHSRNMNIAKRTINYGVWGDLQISSCVFHCSHFGIFFEILTNTTKTSQLRRVVRVATQQTPMGENHPTIPIAKHRISLYRMIYGNFESSVKNRLSYAWAAKGVESAEISNYR